MLKWKAAAQALAAGRQLIAPALETMIGQSVVLNHSLLQRTQRSFSQHSATGTSSGLLTSARSILSPQSCGHKMKAGQGLRASCFLVSATSDEREPSRVSMGRSGSSNGTGVPHSMPRHSTAIYSHGFQSMAAPGDESDGSPHRRAPHSASPIPKGTPEAAGEPPKGGANHRAMNGGNTSGGSPGVELSDQALPDNEILKTLGGYLLSGEQPGFRRRIAIAMGLLVASKALTIQVSFSWRGTDLESARPRPHRVACPLPIYYFFLLYTGVGVKYHTSLV